MVAIPNRHNPEWTLFRIDSIPNGHYPKYTLFEWTQFRMYTIPNGHHLEWTQSRMDTIPNGHNPEWTQSRIDNILIVGFNSLQFYLKLSTGKTLRNKNIVSMFSSVTQKSRSP